MKTMKILTLLLIVTVTFNAQFVFASGTGSSRQTRDVKGFHGVSVANGIDLYLTQKNTEEVVVEASDEYIDKIITTVEGGILKIYVKDRSFINFSWNHESKKVYVSFKELSKLYASSGSDVVSQALLKLGELDMDASSGADIELELEAKNVTAESSSGSDISLKGKTDDFHVSASSGSDVDAGSFESRKCNASASSGSDVKVYVTEELSANASSGGDIYYSGNPKTKDINESSGGDVHGR